MGVVVSVNSTFVGGRDERTGFEACLGKKISKTQIHNKKPGIRYTPVISHM
jgi:hypothetical protein